MTRPGTAEYARLSFNGTMDASETRRFVLLDGKRAPELTISLKDCVQASAERREAFVSDALRESRTGTL